jgi:hypothetical protein
VGAAVVVTAIAAWAGAPAYLLLVLICPVAMVLVMVWMSGGNARGGTGVSDTRPGSGAETSTGGGAPERIGQP